MPAIFPDNRSLASDDISVCSKDVLSLMVPRTRRPAAVTLPYIPSPNPFHTLDLYLPESGLCPTTKWLIFIHGGYWRDASQSKDVGASILTRLPPHWAGASIDYRLSPEVEHPDHLHDVSAAVQFLRNAYGISSAVILAHGAGACMAFQYVAARLSLGETWVKHIVGSGGVYDLLDVSQQSPCYKSYILDAYGADADNWDDSSPARLEWDALYGPDVADLKFTLVHSKHDTLVPLRQVLQFEDTLTKAGFTATLRLVDIHDHDAVLETSDLINVVVNICEEMDHKEEQHYLRLLE